MGRKKKKVIKRIKRKLPTKVFNCPVCYSEKTFRIQIDNKSKEAVGRCSDCKIELRVALRLSREGKIAKAYREIDYYCSMSDILDSEKSYNQIYNLVRKET